MNIIGVIAEFNPFHNGHKYYLEKIKEMYPDSIIISVLSTSFSQRGDLSILNKFDKTNISLNNGIDIVLELPYFFTVQSADIFAHASLQILNEFKIDTLVFGSESNDIEYLKSLIGKEEKLEDSNDILGISYLKEIIKNNYNITPVTIKRTNKYNDKKLDSSIVSASNIRERLYNNENINKFIPNNVSEYLRKINQNKYIELLRYKSLDKNLTNYLDVNDELENRFKDNVFKSNTIGELIKSIKTKRYNYSKISRMLNHILVGLEKNDINTIKDIEYIRILGFNDAGRNYIHSIKKNFNYKITYKYNKEYVTSNYELKATKIYSILTNDKEIIDKEIKKNVIN